ncbi:MAG: hypothetical protein QM676_09855 [Novosphingobium sp.]
MSEAASPQEVLCILVECQRLLDGLGAELAAAHLDSAIHALCEQFTLAREILPSA